MYKLLLVDDETIIRDGIHDMVDWSSLGIALSASCSDAFSALDSMLDNMPDILLTDVRMPGLSGLELIEQALALHPQLQILILSGFDEFTYAQQAMKYGVKEYLLKPCSKEEMEQALERVCRELDRQGQRTLHLADERQVRVKKLVEQLNKLCSSNLEASTLERQVIEIAKTVEEHSLLQEALLTLISSVNASQAEWGFSVMQNALKKPEQLEALVVRCLLHLRGENSVRGFVQKMTAYIDAHYGEETLSLQFLADQVVFMNTDYIGREFTRCMGLKFSAYLLQVRMEHAKELIATHPQMHSYEIAERVGLGHSPHYFSQVFRKYTGLTTKEYRIQQAKITEN